MGDISESLSKEPVFDFIFFCVETVSTPNKPVLQRLKRILIFASRSLRACGGKAFCHEKHKTERLRFWVPENRRRHLLNPIQKSQFLISFFCGLKPFQPQISQYAALEMYFDFCFALFARLAVAKLFTTKNTKGTKQSGCVFGVPENRWETPPNPFQKGLFLI